MPGIVGELVGTSAVVVVMVLGVGTEDLDVVVEDIVVVDMVLDASSLTVPMTQYDLVVSRSGQVIPGFSC